MTSEPKQLLFLFESSFLMKLMSLTFSKILKTFWLTDVMSPERTRPGIIKVVPCETNIVTCRRVGN